VLDDAGGFSYASPAAVALFGEAGGPIEDYAHPDDRALVREAIAQARSGALAGPVEFRLRDRTGGWRAVSVVARDLRDHPSVTGIAFYAADTTRARAAERRERVEYTRLMTLVESLKVGVLVQDEQRRVVLTNAAYVELFADSDAARAGADEVARRGRPLFGDEVALRGGRVVERDYVPITLDGSTLGHLWVFRDVTTQAEARRALEERNRILTELAALKTDFVAVLSHELRTPLTSIATFAGMLDLAEELDPGEYRAAVGAIRRNADRMMSLVEDLVLLARLESRAIRPGTAPVDLPALLRATAPAPPAPTAVPDGPPVCGDEDLLRELFETVFGVVAATGAGAVDLRAAVVDGRWEVRVHATTTEPATTERLLSSRLPHPRHPGEHRTGALALMLARAIADRHGGHLASVVAPTEVTVTVSLPVA
jgi:signal transduction histidine kinase